MRVRPDSLHLLNVRFALLGRERSGCRNYSRRAQVTDQFGFMVLCLMPS